MYALTCGYIVFLFHTRILEDLVLNARTEEENMEHMTVTLFMFALIHNLLMLKI